MTTPICIQNLEAIHARLATISTAGGFNTDVNLLAIGQQPMLKTDLGNGYALGLWEQADVPNDGRLDGTSLMTQNMVIEGVAKRTRDTAELTLLMRLWQDVIKAVFTADPTLGGLAMAVMRGPRTFIYSEAGEGVTGFQQAVNVQYQETYGDP